MSAQIDHKQPVKIALLGAGIFACDAHIPAFCSLTERFEVVAVYSRTEQAARNAASKLPGDVAIYTDLAALLARPDLEAVDVVMPISVMPKIVEAALRADKHVISEKPMAPTVAQGRNLLALYDTRNADKEEKLVWIVGENWRYEDAFLQAQQIVASGKIGQPVSCSYALHMPFTPQSKYYHSAWRRTPDFAGGLLLDGGVHHSAALRLIMGEITEVSATMSQWNPELTTPDTLSATLRFANGAMGSYLVSYAARAFWHPTLSIVGTEGSLRVERTQLELDRDGDRTIMPCTGFDGVEKELAAFANAIRQPKTQNNSAIEALRDLAVVEALLASAETRQFVKVEVI